MAGQHLPYFNILVAVGAAAAFTVFDWLNRNENSPPEMRRGADRAVLLALVVAASGVLGSVSLSDLLAGRTPFSFPWSFTFFGGFLGGAIGFLVSLRFLRLPFGTTADHLAVGLSVGHAFGRIGCYVGGCCYGRSCGACSGWNWLPFLDGRLPVQLMEAGCEILNFLVLLWFCLRGNLRSGSAALMWMILYSSQRIILEMFRDDPRGEFPILPVEWGISPSQAIAICLISIGLPIFLILNLRSGNRLTSARADIR